VVVGRRGRSVHNGRMAQEAPAPLVVPQALPFLQSLAWSDARWRDLSPLDMLRRYEAGWRHFGVLADPSPEELAFIRALVHRFGSYLHV